MTIMRCLHPSSNVVMLYLPWKDGGRGLLRVEECVMPECKFLHEYLQNNQE